MPLLLSPTVIHATHEREVCRKVPIASSNRPDRILFELFAKRISEAFLGFDCQFKRKTMMPLDSSANPPEQVFSQPKTLICKSVKVCHLSPSRSVFHEMHQVLTFE